MILLSLPQDISNKDPWNINATLCSSTYPRRKMPYFVW